MTRLLGATAEDAERWWQAWQLAETGQAGELRRRAEGGDEHARRQLAGWLDERAEPRRPSASSARSLMPGTAWPG